jgi:hypothetical protein
MVLWGKMVLGGRCFSVVVAGPTLRREHDGKPCVFSNPQNLLVRWIVALGFIERGFET